MSLKRLTKDVRKNKVTGSTNLQFLVNLLLDRSTHLRRVDSHYSRARSVVVLERVSSSVQTLATMAMTILASATRLTDTADIGAHILSRRREAVPRDDGDDGGSNGDAATDLLHGSACSREAARS